MYLCYYPRRRQISGDVSSSSIQPLIKQQQQQQLVSARDNGFTQSRSEALHNVESTIHELGNIFTQLATMVSQQGDIAIRFVLFLKSTAFVTCETLVLGKMKLNNRNLTTGLMKTWIIPWEMWRELKVL